MSIEWNGEGLPPVGCECEYKVRQAANQDWKTCTVIAAGKEHLIADAKGEEVVFFAPQIEFRPMPTEAERKRDEAIVALTFVLTSLPRDQHVTEWSQAILEQIAAGKIPHITLK